MAYSKQTWHDLPDQTTPINAERLNHIEDGIYNDSVALANKIVDEYSTSTEKGYSANYINENFQNKPTILYSDNSGSYSTINLSDSVNNYSYIEILYHIGTSTTGGYTKAIPNSGRRIELHGVENDGGGSYERMANITFDTAGTTGTITNRFQAYFSGNNRTYTAMTEAIRIIRVIGYK